jgi:Flp pilus assembly pilin Flp
MSIRLHARWIAITDRDAGATMPEYVLIVAFIGLIALVGAAAVGISLRPHFEAVDTKVRP